MTRTELEAMRTADKVYGETLPPHVHGAVTDRRAILRYVDQLLNVIKLGDAILCLISETKILDNPGAAAEWQALIEARARLEEP